MEDQVIIELTKARTALIRAYIAHVAWFAVMCIFVSSQWSQRGLQASVLLTLVTVPPVLYYTVRVHKICRSIDPTARSVGWVPVLVTTLVLSPFESGLVLPAKNLLVANRIIRAHRQALVAVQPAPADGPNNSFKPKPLRGSA